MRHWLRRNLIRHARLCGMRPVLAYRARMLVRNRYATLRRKIKFESRLASFMIRYASFVMRIVMRSRSAVGVRGNASAYARIPPGSRATIIGISLATRMMGIPVIARLAALRINPLALLRIVRKRRSGPAGVRHAYTTIVKSTPAIIQRTLRREISDADGKIIIKVAADRAVHVRRRSGKCDALVGLYIIVGARGADLRKIRNAVP